MYIFLNLIRRSSFIYICKNRNKRVRRELLSWAFQEYISDLKRHVIKSNTTRVLFSSTSNGSYNKPKKQIKGMGSRVSSGVAGQKLILFLATQQRVWRAEYQYIEIHSRRQVYCFGDRDGRQEYKKVSIVCRRLIMAGIIRPDRKCLIIFSRAERNY